MRNGRRDRKKEAFWRRIILGQATSGLSIRAWCRRRRVREASFYWWRTQLAQRDEQAPAFVPVRVPAEPAAVLFSLMATCQRHKVDPFAYLRDVLTRLPATPVNELDSFLPDHWSSQRTAAAGPAPART